MAEGATVHDVAAGPASAGSSAKGASALRRFGPAALLLAGLGLGYAFGLHRYLSLDFLAASRDMLKAEAARHGVLAPVAFAAVYAVAVAFSFPAASVLTIVSGFLFGWLLGGVLAIIAATLGAAALFLAARSALGGALRERAGGFAARLGEGFRRGAFLYLLALRFAPFLPFWIVNIVPALFGVRLRTYAGATFLGIMPGAFAYAWLGEGLDSVLLAARVAGRGPRAADLVTPEITVAFAALAGVAVLAALTRRMLAARAAPSQMPA